MPKKFRIDVMIRSYLQRGRQLVRSSQGGLKPWCMLQYNQSEWRQGPCMPLSRVEMGNSGSNIPVEICH